MQTFEQPPPLILSTWFVQALNIRMHFLLIFHLPQKLAIQ